MNLLINVCLAIFVLVALLLVLFILMQRPKSEGLGAAFGAAVTENIFGAQTTNVLTRITAWLAGIFFVLTFALSILYAHKSMGDSSLRRELLKTQGATSPSPAAPVSSPAPNATASVLPVAAGTPVISPSPAATQATSATVAPVASPTATAKPKRKRP